MASCRYCGVEIFFAWHPMRQRWVPIDPESINGEERLTEGDGGVLYESHHRRHNCAARGPGREREPHRARTTEEARRPAPEAVRTESWAHATLFVSTDAPPEVIRAAYKALAMLYHPDLGGDPALMVELNVAYAQLVGKNQAV